MNVCKHYWVEHYVKTDAGESVLTVCKFCMVCKVDQPVCACATPVDIRPMRLSDLAGVVECLSVFGSRTNILKDGLEIDGTITFVAMAGNQVVGTARLVFIERLVKGCEARIEDVAVLPGFLKQGIGTKLVIHLRDKAIKEHDCYKVQLTCRPELERWYSSLGFRRHEVNMRIDA